MDIAKIDCCIDAFIDLGLDGGNDLIFEKIRNGDHGDDEGEEEDAECLECFFNHDRWICFLSDVPSQPGGCAGGGASFTTL